jgi:hypothetical protein
MEPDSVSRHDLDTGLAYVVEEFEAKLEKVQDRVLTAISGFVNGASARMERLESVDNISRKEIAQLERRIRALERRGRKNRVTRAK